MRATVTIGLGALVALTACDDPRGEADPFASAGGVTATGGATSGGDDDDDDDDDAEDPDPEGDSGAADGTTGSEQTIDLKWDVGWSGETDGNNNASDCMTDPNADEDGDGFSVVQGDCNDCDPNVNPGAIEVIDTEPDEMGVVPDPADEDCDGAIDNVPPPCDGALAINNADPLNGAAAMGLCKVAQDATDWGIVSASYVRADGSAAASPLQHGLLFDFGPNVAPQEGSQMLVLSTGRARIPGQPDVCGMLTCSDSGAGTAPAGFPQDVPACPGLSNINDDIALEVTLRAPTNATGFSYNFNFYSFEYPEWVCTSYNDQYIALVDPPPMGAINGNISFDSNNNPVSVNIAFFDVCAGCPLGTGELSGNGFDTWNDAGATSWLVTTSPVTGGEEVTIRFAIWDTGDTAYDSTVLLDNFQWIADGGTVSVGTVPEG